MKTLLWTAPKRMEIAEAEKPVPGSGEVLIQVASVGICGSDLEGYLGHNSLRVPPLLMGHEIAGTIHETGDRTADVRIGDRVVVNPLISCNSCDSCIRGHSNLCRNRKIIGIHRPGGYAEYAVAPVGNVVAISPSLTFERASLAEPLACALRAVRRAMSAVPFANVMIVGAGPLGILSAFVSRLLGAGLIAIVDKNQARLNMARQLGFDGAFDNSAFDMEDQLRKFAGPRGIDVVIDAAGFQSTRTFAAQWVNRGGVIMNMGLGIDETVLQVNHFIRSEIDVKGSFCYTGQDFMDALRLLSDGRVTEEGWSEVRPLDAGAAAIEALVAGHAGKILLQP